MTTRISPAEQKRLVAEAVTALGGYLATGIDGLFQKTIDRCSALDLDVAGITADRAGAERLLALLAETTL